MQRPRGSGWTPDRQRKFIEALAASACVTEAAASVGLSATAAYNLRKRPDAHAFRLAWDAAIEFGMRRLVDAALSRAVHGVAVPIFWKGEQVGERREYPERLAMFLMRAHDPHRFGAARLGAQHPAAAPLYDAPGAQLAQALDDLDEQAKAGAPAEPPRLTGPAPDESVPDAAPGDAAGAPPSA
ncbi:hypothetical protein [Sphingopyxis sp.]|uniref:hypothetical protein n=1 Tax=Sphingopyxis sp. TaxID=1908224 RepID=UPI003D6D0383